MVPLNVPPAAPRMLLEALVSKTRAQHPAARRLLDGPLDGLLDGLLATYQPIERDVERVASATAGRPVG